MDDRAYFDCISLRELQASNGTCLCILAQDPPSVLDMNGHCYLKFFLVGGSTLNRLGHVVAHYPGRIRIHIKSFSSSVVLVGLDRLFRV